MNKNIRPDVFDSASPHQMLNLQLCERLQHDPQITLRIVWSVVAAVIKIDSHKMQPTSCARRPFSKILVLISPPEQHSSEQIKRIIPYSLSQAQVGVREKLIMSQMWVRRRFLFQPFLTTEGAEVNRRIRNLSAQPEPAPPKNAVDYTVLRPRTCSGAQRLLK